LSRDLCEDQRGLAASGRVDRVLETVGVERHRAAAAGESF
jgi:hypothetical protein